MFPGGGTAVGVLAGPAATSKERHPGMTAIVRRSVLLLPVAAAKPARANGLWLVTDREAALAPSPNASAARAVMRGPGVRFIAPGDAAVRARTPFWLRVEFAPRGGSRIAANAITVTLLRAASIDLTQRLQPFLSATALDVPEALAPPGVYALRFDVTDDQGRTSNALIQLNVT